MKQWFSFFLIIMKHGKLFRSLYSNVGESIRFWRRTLLKTPILCQLIALASIYRQNKQQSFTVYHCNDKKLAFVLINKNASTSIVSSFLQIEYPNKSFEKMTVRDVHQLAKTHTKSFIESGYESFVVVRNPMDRLLSCYYDQVKDRDQTGYFSHLYFGIFKQNLSFDQFVQLVAKIPDSIKEPHFRVQKYCVPDTENLRVFKFENMNDEIIPYLKKHGLSVEWQNQNRNKKNDSISNRTESLVKSIYLEDFKAFNF
ncbi:MAG: sulfotransferase family 2 domain-containing protein [Reichenbachiella sp.]|uniref:sulfotransferase family 2 domain-containing protein n=1 Tax=Reichenbachiella sp. TaxID=2184521 RepID=UPI00329A4CC9